MTDLAPSTPARPGAGVDASDFDEVGYSKDYWDAVFEQVGRRPLVKAALAALALLYAAAIFAPFLANDRPFFLEAVDRQEYDSARKGLSGVTSSLFELCQQGEDGFVDARLAVGSEDLDYAAALESERGALRLRLDTMRSYLSPDDHGPLDELQVQVDELVGLAKGGDSAQAVPLAEKARSSARSLRSSHRARDESSSEGLELFPQKSYPLWAATTWLEIFFMTLWLGILTWPLWNRLVNRFLAQGDREKIRKLRRRKLQAVLVFSVGCALLWQVAVGGSMTFEASVYKTGLTSGEITAERVLFPPLAIGFAETHVEEQYRPPTWLGGAEINEEGYYVRGGRVPEPDPITGRMPPADPVEVRYGEPERNDNWRHFLGTDILGRDLFVRMLYGGRISLTVGLLSTAFLVLIGVVVGAVAGFFGGRVDLFLSRVIEIVQCIPSFFLILVVVALIPDDKIHPIFAIVITIAIVRWTGVARLVRGEFLKLKEQDFVVAAQACGLSSARVIFRHVLPNAMGPVLVAAAFAVASGILTESGISFLGFGIKHPIPSWGSLLNESRAAEQWWLQVFPGILIFVTVLCYNLVGEGIRDALDPRMKV